jgi:hypothetical protein
MAQLSNGCPAFHAAQRLSRRALLQVGASSVFGLSLPQLFGAEQSSKTIAPKADACIVIYLNGGPSHLDMWDMKPDAPDNIRGPFKSIASSLTGVPVCEHLPQLGKWLNQATLVRSMNHTVNNAHALAVYTALTGHDKGDGTRAVGHAPDDHPSPGAVLARLRPVPPTCISHVALPYKTKEGVGGPPQPGFYGGLIGANYDPLWVLNDPSAANFGVPELTLSPEVTAERLGERGRLLSELNARVAEKDTRGALDAMNGFQQRALDVLSSSQTQRAFKIEEEPAPVRDAYGRNIYGQSVLLARRLIEAGTRVVTVSWAPDANATWDTHGSNFKKLKETLLPQLDAAYGSLMTDLKDRGRLERTLVVVSGDFGRTPKINNNDGGRDHWNYCYTIMLAGGGIKPGYVFGASDRTGAFPADRPVSPGDVLATMYQLLGIDYSDSVYDRTNRPHRIVPKGDCIDDLIA